MHACTLLHQSTLSPSSYRRRATPPLPRACLAREEQPLYRRNALLHRPAVRRKVAVVLHAEGQGGRLNRGSALWMAWPGSPPANTHVAACEYVVRCVGVLRRRAQFASSTSSRTAGMCSRGARHRWGAAPLAQPQPLPAACGRLPAARRRRPWRALPVALSFWAVTCRPKNCTCADPAAMRAIHQNGEALPVHCRVASCALGLCPPCNTCRMVEWS